MTKKILLEHYFDKSINVSVQKDWDALVALFERFLSNSNKDDILGNKIDVVYEFREFLDNNGYRELGRTKSELALLSVREDVIENGISDFESSIDEILDESRETLSDIYGSVKLGEVSKLESMFIAHSFDKIYDDFMCDIYEIDIETNELKDYMLLPLIAKDLNLLEDNLIYHLSELFVKHSLNTTDFEITNFFELEDALVEATKLLLGETYLV